MPDQPAYPPPPPPNIPPPAYQPPPGYQPQAPSYASGWAPGQPAQPYLTPAAAAGTAGGILYQFGGAAAWSIGFGLVSMVAPFAVGFYFPVMPIIGLLNAWRAITRGRVMGGFVGVALNILGGIVTLLAYLSTR